MKKFRANKKGNSSLFNLIFLSLITLNSFKTLTKTKIKDICSNSDDYINNYFDENQDLNEKYENFRPNPSFSINDDYIIKMLFLDKSSIGQYKENKLKKYKNLKIMLIFGLLISFAIAIIFEIHFVLRLFEGKEELRVEHKKATLLKFWKISSFCWIRYLIYNRKQKDAFYHEFREKNIPKTSRITKIFFLLISLSFLVIALICAAFNIIKSNEPEKLVNNISCALMKFLYEVKVQPFRKSNYIGLNKIILFLNDTNSNISELIIKNFITQFSIETSKKFSEWSSKLNNLDNKLADQNGKEFFIENYYSKKDYSNEDIENVEKTLFQLINITKYYPSNDSTKLLYQMNNFFHENADNIFTVIEKIYDLIIKNNLNSEKKEDDESNTVYNNIINQLDQIIDMYIDELLNNYLTNFHKNLINNHFSFLFIIDFIYLEMLGLCGILFIPLMQYGFQNQCYKNKLIIPIIFYNNLFVLLILSLFSSMKIINIKEKSIYINDLSKVVYYLLDQDNQEYLENNFDYTINNKDFNIMDENGIYKNIFYYFNYIFNSKFNITDLYNIKYSQINIQQINDLYIQLNNIISNEKNLLYFNITNPNIDTFSEELSTIIKEGILPDTNFKDVAGIGYGGSGFEAPINYLSFINIKTRKGTRYIYHVTEFDCDESWNISSYNFNEYVYRNRSDVLDCQACNNHYYKKFELYPPALLNYKEYSLEEIKERYNDLLKIVPEVYYGIIYQATGLDNFLRNDIVINQVKKLLNENENLKTLQAEIFESLNQSFFYAKQVITYFENLSEKYSNSTNINFGDLLNFDFARKDMLFILGEIELTFTSKINQYYRQHLGVYGMSIFLSVIFIVFYSLISYEIPLEKGRVEKKDKITEYTQHIRDLITQKKLEIYENKDFRNHNSNKHLNSCTNSNIGNVNVIQKEKINDNNNLNPQYNTMVCEGKSQVFSEKDLLSLNQKINNKLCGLNKFFNQSGRIYAGKKNLTVVEEEKEEDYSNAVDQSRNNIIEKELKSKASIVKII